MLDENGKDICIERRYCYKGYVESKMNPGYIGRYFGIEKNPRIPNGYIAIGIAIGLKGGYAMKYICLEAITRP